MVELAIRVFFLMAWRRMKNNPSRQMTSSELYRLDKFSSFIALTSVVVFHVVIVGRGLGIVFNFVNRLGEFASDTMAPYDKAYFNGHWANGCGKKSVCDPGSSSTVG